jgi:hypothetical protein
MIDEFWQICNAAHECWRARRGLFEDNTQRDYLLGTFCGPFLEHLSRITQQYVLHQIAKLHDPPVQNGNINLSIGYLIDYGGWDASTSARLLHLKGKLDSLANALKPVRNKITAHNDLATILAGLPLGNFSLDADIEYFNYLQDFMDTVAGTPRPFVDLIRNDAQVFVESLVRGAKS